MMKDRDLIQGNLQQAYFQITSNLSHLSYEESLHNMIKAIKQVLHLKWVGVYRYLRSTNSYHIQLMDPSNEINVLNQLPLNAISNDNQFGKCIIDRSSVFYLKLKDRNFSKVLVCFKAFQIDPTILAIVQSESQRLIMQLDQYYPQQINYPFLYDLSICIFTMKRKSSILNEVIDAICEIYPTHSLHLLLAHDTEVDYNFSVKSMAYTDDSTNGFGSKAFMTEEVQIEKIKGGAGEKLYVPLTGRQGVYGVIQLISKSCDVFAKSDVDFITHIAQTAGKAIENASLLENANLLIADLKLINEVTHQLNSNLNLTDITEFVRKKIKEVCRASEIGFIFQRSDGSHADVLTASTAYFKKEENQSLVDKLLKDIVHPTFYGKFEYIPTFPYHSLMIIPLRQDIHTYGHVVIMHEASYFFSFEVFKLLQSLIQHCSLALANAILKEELEKAVITDYLTKLYSRNYLEKVVTNQMKTARMGSLILFDIDDFKRINDTYGHHVGDEVLKQVADVIMRFSEQDAIPSRWGGEELAIYTPNLSIDDAVQIAAGIREQVEERTNPTVTLSCGVSSWSEDFDDSVSELFIRADKALYEAKHRGKNSVVKRVKDR
nr:diguanylate cyclase [Priestia megaterium]